MTKSIFINLPVTDVARSAAFYAAIGFEPDARFSGDGAAALRWSDTITIMLASHDRYADLTPKRIIDAREASGALFALGLDSRAAVDAISEAAVAAGGRELHGAEDHGFMYARAFEDPDGHGFGPMWLDAGAFDAAMARPAGAA
ncbi:VOC family protein [Sphingomonas bacterium]|uniref:VOC family protein n=1 Tax=Sphingomonas bacterium TaxID=1895847 RepID=UPI001576DE37|nr:VOC family protein [Sphingomonas bacterium]